MGAGAINPFYNPQTSNPISMFVEDKLPVDLMLKAGLTQQGVFDTQRQSLNALNAYIDPKAAIAHDQVAREGLKKEIEGFVEKNYSNVDLRDPQVQANIYNKIKEVRDNKILQTTSANTAKIAEIEKTADDLRKKGASDFAIENYYNEVRKPIEAYRKTGVVGDLGDLNLTQGVDTEAARKALMGDLTPNGRETNSPLGQYLYSNTVKDITWARVGDVAQSKINNYLTSAAGKQDMNLYKMWQETSPENLQKPIYDDKGKDTGKTKEITPQEFVLDRLKATASNQVMSDQSSNLSEVWNKNADATAEDTKLTQLVINPGATVPTNQVTKGIGDLSKRITEEVNPEKKRNLMVLKDRVVGNFNATPEGKEAMTMLNNERIKAVNHFAGEFRQSLSTAEQAFLSKYAPDIFNNIANKLRNVQSSYDLNRITENPLKDYINYDELSSDEKSLYKKVGGRVISSIPNKKGNILFGGTSDSPLLDSLQDYEESFNDFSKESNVSIGSTVFAADAKQRDVTNKQFLAADPNDFRMVNSNEALDLRTLNKIKADPNVQVSIHNDPKLTSQFLEVQWTNPATKETEVMLVEAVGQDARSIYATIAKNHGPEGQKILNRATYGAFMPEPGQKKSLRSYSTNDARLISADYTAMTTRDGFLLYNKDKPVTVGSIIQGLPLLDQQDKLSHLLLQNKTYNPKGEKTIDMALDDVLHTNKKEEDILNTIFSQDNVFDNAAEMFEYATIFSKK